MKNLVEEARSLGQRLYQNTPDDTEERFEKFIASQLRGMSDARKASVMQRISQLMFEAD